jgi:large subunit ribosomal protein L29
MTKIAELRSKTTDQLHEQLLSLKKEQFNLRFQKATGQLEKTHRVNEIRKDVARIQSLLTAQKAAAKTA